MHSHATFDGLSIQDYKDETDFMDSFIECIKKPCQTKIVPINIYAANMSRDNQTFRRLITDGDMTYCDGAGIIIGARIAGQHLTRRFTAADFFVPLLHRLIQENLTTYIVASKEEVVDSFRRQIKDFPCIVGLHNGYVIGAGDIEKNLIMDIKQKAPDLLVVGMGHPKQEMWIDQWRRELPEVGCFVGLGTVLTYLTGHTKRCPGWMGNFGLEWLFRFFLEPKRMFSRYIIGNPRFIVRMIIQRMIHSPSTKWQSQISTM